VNGAGTGPGNSDSYYPVVGATARYVAFYSYASDLGPGDTNNTADVYVRDRLTGTNILCSRNLSGNSGNSPSYDAILSANERIVLFRSYASDLVASDTNNTYDIFAYDLLTHTVALVSANTNGVPGNGYSYDAGISADGRYVAFYSEATDLVPNDINGFAGDIFVRDLIAGTTTLISVNCHGTGSADDYSYTPTISADGRYVAFESSAHDLVSGNFNGYENIFRRDRLTSTTVIISQNQSLTAGGNGYSFNASLSTNGSTVVFLSGASDLIPSDGNGEDDAFVWREGAVTPALTRPTLSVALTNGNQLLVSWPSSTPNVFSVQTATNLIPVINWTTLTNAISDNGTVKFVLLNVNPTETERFFRLKN